VIMEVTTIYLPFGGVDRKKRILDPTKIDYRVEAHSSSSQLCIGVDPKGTTAKEVEARVRGTFGGRFNKFANGHFEYVAYTD
jgi:glutamate synthase domain-containing protein 3